MATKPETTKDTNLERLALGVDCHRCGAWTDTPCTTPAGKHTTPHTRRIDRAVKFFQKNK